MQPTSSFFFCCPGVSPLKINCLLALLSSLFFFSAWWILIALLAENYPSVDGTYVLPAIFGSAALIMVNIVPAAVIHDPHSFYNDSCVCGRLGITTFLLIGFMAAFGTLIGACYILFNDFILDKNEPQKWPGYSVFLQNFFIFVATVLLRLRRPYYL